MTVVRDRIAQLEAELRDVRAQRQAQYWAFTRQSRAKPVDPALCRREIELEADLKAARLAGALTHDQPEIERHG